MRIKRLTRHYQLEDKIRLGEGSVNYASVCRALHEGERGIQVREAHALNNRDFSRLVVDVKKR